MIPNSLRRYERPTRVLDNGHVVVVDVMGDDRAIAQAARTSYGKRDALHVFGEDDHCNYCGASRRPDREWQHCSHRDIRLIRRLMRDRHTSPFEMCEIKLHVKLPIFVARQWIRHRTANVNEYSARYSALHEEFYIPEAGRLAIQSKINKQGSGEPVPDAWASEIRNRLEEDGAQSFALYSALLNSAKDGSPIDPAAPQLARELARINLPLGAYTEWIWKIDLHNLLHFLSLRMHPHAQYEIRVYAELIAKIVERWVPVTWRAFEDYRLRALTFSAQEASTLRRIVKAWMVQSDPSEEEIRQLINLGGIPTNQERRDFRAKLDIPPRRLP